MSKLLEVKKLTKNYHDAPDSRDIIKDLDLTVNQGDFLCILGPSGCGKTTLIRCIAGFEDYEGDILVDGVKVDKPGIDRIMVFQDFNQLFPWKTVKKNIQYPLKVNGLKDKAELERIAQEHLDMVGLSDKGDLYPHQLSGGMKQRVVIAMALDCSPDLLLADEPTTALDVTIQAQVLDIIKNLQNELNTAMLMITHDLGIVAEVCDNVAVVYAGEIVEYGSREEIFDHPTHPYTIGLFGSLPDIHSDVKRLSPIAGMPPDPSNLPSGCAFSPRCPYATDVCKKTAASLASLGGTHVCRCYKALDTDANKA